MIGGLKDWAIGLLLLAAMGLGYSAHQSRQEARQAAIQVGAMATQLATANGALKAVIEDRDRSRMLADEKVKIAERKARLSQRKLKDLQDALKDSPGWAAEPVPPGVWDALGPNSRGPDGQAPASSGMAPGLPVPAPPGGADERGPSPVVERI